jgi:hypothetical protein
MKSPLVLSCFVACLFIALPVATAAAPPFASSPLQGGRDTRYSGSRQATGCFRVEQLSGLWWLIDPKGQPTLSIGTDHVSYTAHWCEALGYAPYGRNVQKLYGASGPWADEATRRLRAWNFNVLGAGCSPQTRYHGLAHTEFLSFGADFSAVAALTPKTDWTGWPDVFDPRFESFCETRAAERCRAADDPWLLGYFLDNELEWFGKGHEPWGLAADACALPATAAGKKALVASLRRTFHDRAAAFNAEFDAQLRSFDELAGLRRLPRPKTARAEEALAAFVADAAARYFQVTTAAVRRHDAKHLILGCRFAHDAPDAAWRQAGATCELVAVNVYPRIDLGRQRTVGLEKHLRHCFARCGKPLIVTEWGFPALDARDSQGRPLPSLHGAGMRVDTQQQKAACYAIMQRDLFSLPFIVGSHYFMWCDEPALGISKTFPEDSNYGLVSESDKPYALLTETAARVNAQLADVHAGRIGRAAVSSGLPAPAAATAAQPGEGQLHFQRTAAGYLVETGPLQLVKDKAGGKLFDRVAWRATARDAWTELGCYEAVLQVKTPEGNGWPHADRVTGVRVLQQEPRRLVLEIECAGDAAPVWKAAYRLEFEPGRAGFRTRAAWVENAGKRAWQLAAYYHYLVPRLGRDAAAWPAPPNYWIAVATWRNPALRLHYGALPPQGDERVECMFWKDEGRQPHPDCRRIIQRDLKPGQRWTADADEPDVLVFGLQGPVAGPLPWSSMLPLLDRGEGAK